MTQNQVSFYKAREDARHNAATEALSKEQNKITKQHYNKQDEYTKSHYERSDAASLTSANASAMNAQAAATNAETNRSKYQMEYDIEYNWNQQPLSVTYVDPDTGTVNRWDSSANTMPVYNYPKGMPMSAQLKDSQIMQSLYETINKPKRIEYENAEIVSNVLNKGSGAFSNIFNALYGKQGLMGALESIITE